MTDSGLGPLARRLLVRGVPGDRPPAERNHSGPYAPWEERMFVSTTRRSPG